jgi:nitric oxide reductase activation protein
MSEQSTETAGNADGDNQQDQAAEQDATDWKAESRKWEQRAKDNSRTAKELERQQRASMSDADRAISEAEQRGRTAAATDYGKRLARAEFDSAAGRRNPDFDTASALEFVDLARFIGDDGEPDGKAIKSAVERLVPEPAKGAASFDGGARNTAAGTDMNAIIRKAAGLG